MQKRVSCSQGHSKSAVGSMVFSRSPTDKLFCEEYSDFCSRLLNGESVRTGWRGLSRTCAMALKLLVQTRAVHLQLNGLKYNLDACSRLLNSPQERMKNFPGALWGCPAGHTPQRSRSWDQRRSWRGGFSLQPSLEDGCHAHFSFGLCTNQNE